MNATLTSLQRLRAEGQIIQQRSSLSALAPEQACHQLSVTLRKLRDKATTLPTARPKIEIKAIIEKLVASGHNLDVLDGLEFRALCCAEEVAVQPEFVAALESATDRLKHPRCVFGLVGSYFAGWRTMSSPERLESLLRQRLDDAGNNLILRKWRSSPELFGGGAAFFLARAICEVPQKVDEVLKQFMVAPLSKLGLAARAATAQTACESFRAREKAHEEKVCLEFLKWMTESVLSDLVPMEVFASAVSCLIESDAAIRWGSFQAALQTYVLKLKRLGDPRTRESGVNWRFMSAEAKRRYLAWLARDSIIFFFNTILPNTSENRRRKDFWLNYHGRIKDFQVAVSETDALKVKANQHKTDLLYHSRIDHPTTSAFLMQFEGWGGDYIVIEYSESGNAAYIYKLADFEAQKLTLRTPRFASINHLKFDKTHRIRHSEDWESRTRYRLASEFGIKP